LGVFLDLTKAFDIVSHVELVNILSNFGIKNSSLKWFKSYLLGRKQKVKINNITGEKILITFGVSQGSVLGPILFILYINSVCNLLIDGHIVTYVDDTIVFFFLMYLGTKFK